MDINKLIVSDAALNVIDNGAWVEGLFEDKSVALFVIGQNSEEVQKFLQVEQAAARVANGGKPLTAEDHTKIRLKALGRVIIKDHRGFTSNGEPLKFDREQVSGWVESRNGAELAGNIAIASNRIDTDADSFVGAVTKNLSTA